MRFVDRLDARSLAKARIGSGRSPRRAGGLVALALAALVCSCGVGGEPAPRWIELARELEPPSMLSLAQGWQRAAGMDPSTCREFYMGGEVAMPLERSAWQSGAEPGLWTAPLPGGAFAFGVRELKLQSEGVRDVIESAPDAPPGVGGFRVRDGRLELRLPAGHEPPDGLRLVQYAENGRRASDGVWQVRIGSDEVHAGLPVWSGQTVEVGCDVPPASRLTFEARFLSRAPPGKLALRVRLDGESVFESIEDSSRLATAMHRYSFELPPRARRAARLAFDVLGPPGQVLFLHPVVGPARYGTRDARPWPDARPDLVLFLADTFRADGLAAGGGPPELAPNLNRFAADALRFRSARSNAAWTLPSISTIVTGLAPGQHTANDTDSTLPAELATLVERLARAGYRTAAVTDAAFFTPIHGLDQGFESFVQRHPTRWDLDWTVASALELLARDDGRPLFLLVHTYRTHMPYRVGPDEDRGPWDELRRGGCQPLKSRGKLTDAEWRAELARCAPHFRALYREGVRDLDRGFGLLLDGLARGGVLERGFVLFTSDHGEALGENDDIFHGGALWDSKLRIPLLVSGPGLAPRDLDELVTLLDVAPTLGELAGLEPDPAWPGASLLAPPSARAAWAFRLQKTSQVALVEGSHKLLAGRPEALEEGSCELAFDLARDPREEQPVLDQGWPAELARRRAAELRALLAPATGSAKATVSDQHMRELRDLGYGGDEEADDEDQAPPPAKGEKPQ